MKVLTMCSNDKTGIAVRQRARDCFTVSGALNLVPAATGEEKKDGFDEEEIVVPNMELTTEIIEKIKAFAPVGLVYTADEGVPIESNSQKTAVLEILRRHFKPEKKLGNLLLPFFIAMDNEKNSPLVDTVVGGMQSWVEGDFKGAQMAWAVRSGPFKLGPLDKSTRLTHEQYAKVLIDIALHSAGHWNFESHIIDDGKTQGREKMISD